MCPTSEGKKECVRVGGIRNGERGVNRVDCFGLAFLMLRHTRHTLLSLPAGKCNYTYAMMTTVLPS